MGRKQQPFAAELPQPRAPEKAAGKGRRRVRAGGARQGGRVGLGPQSWVQRHGGSPPNDGGERARVRQPTNPKSSRGSPGQGQIQPGSGRQQVREGRHGGQLRISPRPRHASCPRGGLPRPHTEREGGEPLKSLLPVDNLRSGRRLPAGWRPGAPLPAWVQLIDAEGTGGVPRAGRGRRRHCSIPVRT